MLIKRSNLLLAGVCFLVGASFVEAAEVAPLYFDNVSRAPIDAPKQQASWDYLMKYKVWGTQGIAFLGQNINMPDPSGWFGTATGDFTTQNNKHTVGGPILIGGSISFADGNDSLLTGPVRVLNNFNVGNFNAPNYLAGNYCVQGTLAPKAAAIIPASNRFVGANYAACPAGVPAVIDTMIVPSIDEASVSYQPGLSANNSTIYIDVPRAASGLSSDVYDVYINGISFSNDSRLYVRMPAGGRLTRVFIKTAISFGKGSKIQVQYVDAAAVYDNATKKYTQINSFTVVHNKDYLGNLLFYMKENMSWPAFSTSDTIQGTYITKKNMALQQQMRFAGQLIATNISINANFDGSGFLYVPFDPPELNIDPTALASGVFMENDLLVKVPVSLDKIPETDVMFDYCYIVSTNPDAAGVASTADISADMPICGKDTSHVKIPMGFLTPQDSADNAWLKVLIDAKAEGIETLEFKVFKLSGAVLPGSEREGSFTLYIGDSFTNASPVLVQNNSLKVPEHSVAGVSVGTVSATDVDNDALNYTITGGTGFNLFLINKTTGAITVKTTNSIDFETMSTPSYSLEVTVSDGRGGFDVKLYNIAVIDINEAPSITTTVLSVNENSAVNTQVGQIVATDPDIKVTTTFSYSLIAGGTGNALFNVSSSGVVSVKSATLDYEKVSSYTLKVVASDNGLKGVGTPLKDTAMITININNVNELPLIVNQVFSVPENSAVETVVGAVVASDPDLGSLTYTLSGEHSDLFVIDPLTGIIKVAPGADLDYETIPKFILTVKVTDKGISGNNTPLSNTATITINLLDRNESPTIQDANMDVDENVPVGTIVGTVVATDLDSPVLFYSVIQDEAGVNFSVNSNGLISVVGALDFETRSSYTIKVIASDGTLSDTGSVFITINDLNEAPVITSDKFAVAEDATPNKVIGVVTYRDPENDAVTYEIVADVSGKFEIKADGSIVLKSGQTLDYEDQTSYTITVKVTDKGGLSAVEDITIDVTNVLESSTVEITRAETRDSVFLDPETLYVNVNLMNIEWLVDNKVKYDSLTTLIEGKNVIIKKFCDDSKDFCGSDTLIVYLSTKSPVVTLVPRSNKDAAITGVTIVEKQAADDTSFYVNKTINDILVTVRDPVGNIATDSFVVKLTLDTFAVPSSVYKTLGSISKNILLDSSDKALNYKVINGEKTAVFYEIIVEGKAVTITYYEDMDGQRILDDDGREVVIVSYQTTIQGKLLTISYEADFKTGAPLKNEASSGFYDVSYQYKDVNNNNVFVSYPVNSSGKVEKDIEGNIGYNVSYTYTNKYGNTATQTIAITLDQVNPIVQIISPLTGTQASSVSIGVTWTVDGVEQDTLLLQGLEKGANVIIRTYRDKAGNETSDTVYVYVKAAKDIIVKVENPLTKISENILNDLYSLNPPEKGDRFFVSILNRVTGKEEETIKGTTTGTKSGSGMEPYPEFSGTHLGPTLSIEVKLPSINALSGLASLGDLIESDGLIAIEAGGGWDRDKISVSDYVENYCSESFVSSFDFSNPSASPLYSVKMEFKIWVFTSLGSFVDQYTFMQPMNSADFVNYAGVLKMFFELKPDKEGHLRSITGRLYNTGAYLFKGEIKVVSVLQCTLPDQTKQGARKISSEDFLSPFGYVRR